MELKEYKKISSQIKALSNYQTAVKPAPKKDNLAFLNKLTGFKPKVVKEPTKPVDASFLKKYDKKLPQFTEVTQVIEKDISPELKAQIDALTKDLGTDKPTNYEAIALIAIELIKSKKLLDISNIRNWQSARKGSDGFDMDDQRWHGGGSSGTTTSSTYGEVVSGSNNTFTLANTPVAGTVRVFALGQRLTLTTDYTIAGKIITTVNSWSAGDILADYSY